MKIINKTSMDDDRFLIAHTNSLRKTVLCRECDQIFEFTSDIDATLHLQSSRHQNGWEGIARYSQQDAIDMLAKRNAQPIDYLTAIHSQIISTSHLAGSTMKWSSLEYSRKIFGSYDTLHRLLAMKVITKMAVHQVYRDLNENKYVSYMVRSNPEVAYRLLILQYFDENKGIQHRIRRHKHVQNGDIYVQKPVRQDINIVSYCDDYCYLDPKQNGYSMRNRYLNGMNLTLLPYLDEAIEHAFGITASYLPHDILCVCKNFGTHLMSFPDEFFDVQNAYHQYISVGTNTCILSSNYLQAIYNHFDQIQKYLADCVVVPKTFKAMFQDQNAKFYLCFIMEVFDICNFNEIKDINCGLIYYFSLIRSKEIIKNHMNSMTLPTKSALLLQELSNNMVSTEEITDFYKRLLTILDEFLNRFAELDSFSWILELDSRRESNFIDIDLIHKSYHYCIEKRLRTIDIDPIGCTEKCKKLYENLENINVVLKEVQPKMMGLNLVERWMYLLKVCKEKTTTTAVVGDVKLLTTLLKCAFSIPGSIRMITKNRGNHRISKYDQSIEMIRINLQMSDNEFADKCHIGYFNYNYIDQAKLIISECTNKYEKCLFADEHLHD